MALYWKRIMFEILKIRCKIAVVECKKYHRRFYTKFTPSTKKGLRVERVNP